MGKRHSLFTSLSILNEQWTLSCLFSFLSQERITTKRNELFIFIFFVCVWIAHKRKFPFRLVVSFHVIFRFFVVFLEFSHCDLSGFYVPFFAKRLNTYIAVIVSSCFYNNNNSNFNNREAVKGHLFFFFFSSSSSWGK